MGSFPETYNDPREPACVASDSARVRRESWDESKEWNEGGGEGLEKETKGWPPIVT